MQPVAYQFPEELELTPYIWGDTLWKEPSHPHVAIFYDFPMVMLMHDTDGKSWILYFSGDNVRTIAYIAAPRMLGMVDIWSNLLSGALDIRTFFTLGDDISYPRVWLEEGPKGCRSWCLPKRFVIEDFIPVSGVTLVPPSSRNT